ncbi:hypothetical protein CVT25_000257, partial [Psilocybe cyanescens]
RHVRQHSEHSVQRQRIVGCVVSYQQQLRGEYTPNDAHPRAYFHQRQCRSRRRSGGTGHIDARNARKTKTKHALRFAAACVPSGGIKQLKSYSGGLGLGKGLGKATGISLGGGRDRVMGAGGMASSPTRASRLWWFCGWRFWGARAYWATIGVGQAVISRHGGVKAVVWDKDLMGRGVVWGKKEERGREGEGEREFGFDAEKMFRITIKLGLVCTPNAQNWMEFEIYGEQTKRSRPSSISAPPMHGVGTIRSHHGPAGAAGAVVRLQYGDDGGLSSDTGDDQPTAVPLFPSAAHVDVDVVGEDTQRASAGFVNPSPALSPTAMSRFNPKKLEEEEGQRRRLRHLPVHVQGNLMPPDAKWARSAAKKANKEKEGEKEKEKEERRNKFGGL